jgi:hypothetical protein
MLRTETKGRVMYSFLSSNYYLLFHIILCCEIWSVSLQNAKILFCGMSALKMEVMTFSETLITPLHYTCNVCFYVYSLFFSSAVGCNKTMDSCLSLSLKSPLNAYVNCQFRKKCSIFRRTKYAGAKLWVVFRRRKGWFSNQCTKG